MYSALFQLGVPLGLIILAWFSGRWYDHNHLKSLDRREQELSGIILTDLKCFPGGGDPVKSGTMVMGQVVIANDYLKAFLAGIRKIFGGEVKSYELLMARARREAIVRLLTQAQEQGFDAVGNLRLYFSDIGGMSGKKGMAIVEIFACGTAYCRTPETPS